MDRRAFYLSTSAILSALAASACAKPASNLQPASLPSMQGAAFGRIVVVKHVDGEEKDEDVTRACYADFTRRDRTRKEYLALDGTGWVFAAMETGPTYLSRVVCALSGQIRETRMHDFAGFDVPGDGKIAYFGHVQVVMTAMSTGAHFAATVLAGPVGAAIANASAPREAPEYRIINSYDEAVAEYNRRYGRAASLLQPFASIAGPPRNTGPTLHDDAAASGAGASATALERSLGKHVDTAASHCTEAGFRWQRIDDQRFSCSGASLDLGMPLTVEFSICGTAICGLTLNAAAGASSWSDLSKRFARLYQFVSGQYGEPQDRATEPLGDCTDQVKDCIATGRVRTVFSWRSPAKPIISLVLDGGPAGGAPSLHLIYRTPEPAQDKP